MSLFACIFLTIYSFAIGDDTHVIRGTIIEEATQKPIPFAQIVLLDGQLSTISNEQGKFIFRVPKADSYSLVIQHLNFKQKAVTVSDGESLVIKMEYAHHQLRTVKITALTVESILKKVNNNRKKVNRIPLYTEGFLVEKTYLDDSLHNVMEAVLNAEFYHNSNQLIKKISLVKGNQRFFGNPNIKLTSSRVANFNEIFEMSHWANPNKFLNVKTAKNKNFLNPSHFEHYSYTVEEGIIKNQREYYKISFRPKIASDERTFSGYLLVDKENYGILYMTLSNENAHLKSYGTDKLSHISNGTEIIRELEFSSEYQANYVDDLYVPSFISFTDNTLERGAKHINFDTVEYKRNTKFVFNKISDTPIVMEQKGINIPRHITTIQLQSNQDITEEFWESFNLIPLEIDTDSTQIQDSTVVIPTKRVLSKKELEEMAMANYMRRIQLSVGVQQSQLKPIDKDNFSSFSTPALLTNMRLPVSNEDHLSLDFQFNFVPIRKYDILQTGLFLTYRKPWNNNKLRKFEWHLSLGVSYTAIKEKLEEADDVAVLDLATLHPKFAISKVVNHNSSINIGVLGSFDILNKNKENATSRPIAVFSSYTF